MLRFRSITLAFGLVSFATAGVSGDEEGAWAPDPILVYFDGTHCDGTEIQLEVWNRTDALWEPHPVHPTIAASSCQVEDAGWLLNELRWRCAPDVEIDPPWRSFPLFSSDALTRCANQKILEAEAARIRAARSKRLELHIEEIEE